MRHCPPVFAANGKYRFAIAACCEPCFGSGPSAVIYRYKNIFISPRECTSLFRALADPTSQDPAAAGVDGASRGRGGAGARPEPAAGSRHIGYCATPVSPSGGAGAGHSCVQDPRQPQNHVCRRRYPLARRCGTRGQRVCRTMRFRSAQARRNPRNPEAEAQAYFARHAHDWDELRRLHSSDEAIESALDAALGSAPLGRLLDIGTGTGRMAEIFAERAEHIVALDKSLAMLRVARAKLQNLPAQRVELVQGDFGSLPFAAASFDRCVPSGAAFRSGSRAAGRGCAGHLWAASRSSISPPTSARNCASATPMPGSASVMRRCAACCKTPACSRRDRRSGGWRAGRENLDRRARCRSRKAVS